MITMPGLKGRQGCTDGGAELLKDSRPLAAECCIRLPKP